MFGEADDDPTPSLRVIVAHRPPTPYAARAEADSAAPSRAALSG
jgi:hypothetical protein